MHTFIIHLLMLLFKQSEVAIAGQITKDVCVVRRHAISESSFYSKLVEIAL